MKPGILNHSLVEIQQAHGDERFYYGSLSDGVALALENCVIGYAWFFNAPIMVWLWLS
jgi:hypothetical protein